MPIEIIYTYGLFLAFPVALLLVAGLGWRKLATGLVQALLTTVVCAVVCALVVGTLAAPYDRGSGEWRGLGTLAAGVLGFFGGGLVSLVGSLVWLVRTKRLSRERTNHSPALLGAAGLGFAVVLFCLVNVFIGSTPTAASTERLVQQVADSTDSPGTRAEIERRGPEAAPFLISALHRHPYAQSEDTSALGSVRAAPLLELLGRIDSADAKAEVRRWAEADSWPAARAAALCELAAQGEPDAAQRIGEFLGGIKYTGNYTEAKLFGALGKLKASDQVGAIQKRVSKLLSELALFTANDVNRHSVQYLTQDGMLTSHASIQSGLIALNTIGTEEARVAIEQLCKNNDPDRRALLAVMLEKCPSPGTLALLVELLDDSSPLVRESAYLALWHMEPKLQSGQEEKWSEVNAAKLKSAIQQLQSSQP